MALPVIEKLVCTACGGTFFATQRAEQFVAGGYGSAEFRSVSNAPKTYIMCIGCGTPVTPKPAHYAKGSTADLLEQDFRKSVELGQKHRQENSIQNVAKTTASITEVMDLTNTVKAISAAVEDLKATAKTPMEAAKPKKAKKPEVIIAAAG